jgi:hypothetical protein
MTDLPIGPWLSCSADAFAACCAARDCTKKELMPRTCGGARATDLESSLVSARLGTERTAVTTRAIESVDRSARKSQQSTLNNTPYFAKHMTRQLHVIH